jgi:membrane-associated phospholipid phosphatase
MSKHSRRYLYISIILLVSFVVLAALVSPRINPNGSSISASDATAFIQINDAHYTPLNELMILLSQFGRELVWVVVGIALFVFGGWTGRKAAVVMAISMILLIGLGSLAKEIVARPRPIAPQPDFLTTADSDYSFPSGHAVITSAGSAVMLALYRGSYRKLVISIILTIEAFLVCFSRVYVGGHYPFDVVGGILLGVGVAFIFVAATSKIEQVLQPLTKTLKK